jgi:hypothetical protein
MIFIFNQIIGMHLTIHPYNFIEIVKDKQIQPFAITQEMTWGVSENQLESPLFDVVTITNLGHSFFLFPFYNHIQSFLISFFHQNWKKNVITFWSKLYLIQFRCLYLPIHHEDINM